MSKNFLFSLVALSMLAVVPVHANSDKAKTPYRFYVGLSAGHTAQTFGGMKADYAHETDAWRVPGSFEKSDFETGRTMPIQLSAGAAIRDNLRVDVSYLRYSDISMTMRARELLPLDPLVTSHAGGYHFARNGSPDIVSNAVMMSAYYNLDRLIGRWRLRPYIGAGIGMSNNSISDYVVYDEGHYILPGMEGTLQPPGTTISIGSIRALHKGGTTADVAWAFEAGATYNLTDRLLMDFFGRWVNLGRVESNGVFVSQWNGESSSGSIPVGPPFNHGTSANKSTSGYPNYRESGTLSTLDIGARARVLF